MFQRGRRKQPWTALHKLNQHKKYRISPMENSCGSGSKPCLPACLKLMYTSLSFTIHASDNGYMLNSLLALVIHNVLFGCGHYQMHHRIYIRQTVNFTDCIRCVMETWIAGAMPLGKYDSQTENTHFGFDEKFIDTGDWWQFVRRRTHQCTSKNIFMLKKQ